MRSTTKCMTKCYLDSNTLIYWTNELAPLHDKANSIIETIQKNEVDSYLSPLVLDEFLHAMLLRARLNRMEDPHADVMLAIQKMLNLPRIFIINPPTETHYHIEVISLMKTYSLRPRDAYHLLTMQTNGIDGFATFDNDFARVFAANLLEKA